MNIFMCPPASTIQSSEIMAKDPVLASAIAVNSTQARIIREERITIEMDYASWKVFTAFSLLIFD